MLYQITELSTCCALAAIVFIHVSGSGKIQTFCNISPQIHIMWRNFRGMTIMFGFYLNHSHMYMYVPQEQQ